MGLKADLRTALQNRANDWTKRVTDAFAGSYGYQATLPDGTPNPQNKMGFTTDKIADYIREVVRGYETQKAREAVVIPPEG